MKPTRSNQKRKLAKAAESNAPDDWLPILIRGFRNANSNFWLDLFRWLIVACQTATIILTWPLWMTRQDPPLLPAFWWPSVEFDVAFPLLLTLVVTLIIPRVGVLCHVGLLILAMGMDQTRIQPQIISHGILLLSTLPFRGMQILGGSHLVALWFYSGLHKLLSPGYYQGTWLVNQILKNVFDAPSTGLIFVVSIIGAVLEIALACFVVFPRTRRVACLIACLIHGTILMTLVQSGWNQAVWSWNIVMAFAGFALLWNDQQSAMEKWEIAPGWIRFLVLLAIFSPLGYYFEKTDAYLSHCLYSENTAQGTLIRPQPDGKTGIGTRISYEVLTATHAPLPPQHRLFEAYVRRIGQPGDYLMIQDARLGAALRGRKNRLLVLDEHRRLVVAREPLGLKIIFESKAGTVAD